MKNIYSICACLILLTTVSVPHVHAQSWKWGKGSINTDRVCESWHVAVDVAGNVYSAAQILNLGGYSVTSIYWGTAVISNTDYNQIIVASADSAGAYRWGIGTHGQSAFMIDMAADPCGNIYVYGLYNHGSLTFGTYTISNPYYLNEMYFLAKIAADGTVVWFKNIAPQSSYIGNFYSGGIGVDRSGSPYVSGEFNGSSITIGSSVLVNSSIDTNNCDIFFAKYTPLGVPVWANSLGGDSTEEVASVACSKTGDIYLSGKFFSHSLTVGSDVVTNSLGHIKPHMFLAKYDKYGNPRWIKGSVGHNYDNSFRLATDNWNNVYMAGGYKDTLSFGTVTMPFMAYPHTVDYLLKFDSSGNAKWGKSLTGAIYHLNAYGVATDNSGKVWICGGGISYGSGLPEPMFIAEYDSAGVFIDSTSRLAGGEDQNSIATDNRGNLYIGADYTYAPFIVGADTLTGGGEALFIAKYAYPYTSVPVDTIPRIIICQGAHYYSNGAFSCGRWYSSNTAIATVDTGSGMITGMSPGTAVITYEGGTIGYETQIVIVYPHPAPIAGPNNICVGMSVTFSDATMGGSWSSTNTSIATMASSTGILTGVAAGMSIVSYTTPNGCAATDTIHVYTSLPAISGVSSICLGDTITLSNGITGGIWSSSLPSVAGLTAPLVVGISVGTTTISYTIGGSCLATLVITVHPFPAPIAGTSIVCTGNTTTLVETTPLGIWSITGGTATIGTAGVVSGITAGTAQVTYTLPTGCRVYFGISVVPGPSAISGNSVLCLGASLIYTDSVSGGVWNTGSGGTMIIGATTGIAMGIAAGTAVITYAAADCLATKVVTVSLPPIITKDADTLCIGGFITVTGTASGGTWHSGDTDIATIEVTGIVTGISTGYAVITYTALSSCYTTDTVFVTDCTLAITPTSSNTCKFHIFPNPAYADMFIEGDADITTLNVTNMLGQTIYIDKVNSTRRLQLNVTTYPPGMYILKINDVKMLKFVKE